MPYLNRILPLQSVLEKKSVLLLGPRRSGKSSLIRNQIQADRVIDLLKFDQFQALSFRPSSLRESLKPSDKLIVIDEIQKLPALMDEVHAMIEERKCRFVLTGSNARKLKRTHTALLAGRVRRLLLTPFCYPEIIENFELNRYLLRGGLPPVYLAESDQDALDEVKDYAGEYLREEILAEAIVRKIEAFSRFLPNAARMNGELVNFEAVASDAQVPSRTVREYYSVLEDTLVGQMLEPLRFKGAKSRKSIATSKFFFFDCGVLNGLLGRKVLMPDSTEFGNLFETWVLQELVAYRSYRAPDMDLRFWRNPEGAEVDFVINSEIGIEVKSTRSISTKHCAGLTELSSVVKLRKQIIVCREDQARVVSGIHILPWRTFVELLWDGKIL
jgi:predicted AAA+ superfamily ATPase